MIPRVLFHPRVVMSETPEIVCIKTPLDHPESFYETRLSPEEAVELARQLLNDADRAKRMGEMSARLKKR